MALFIHKEKTSLIQEELDKLEGQLILLDGKLIKPSQCYRFSGNPPYVLYNTNCPEDLMKKIEDILAKYKDVHEDRS